MVQFQPLQSDYKRSPVEAEWSCGREWSWCEYTEHCTRFSNSRKNKKRLPRWRLVSSDWTDPWRGKSKEIKEKLKTARIVNSRLYVNTRKSMKKVKSIWLFWKTHPYQKPEKEIFKIEICFDSKIHIWYFSHVIKLKKASKTTKIFWNLGEYEINIHYECE